MSEIRVGSISTEEGVDTFRFVQTVTFETSGTFNPADYPWLRAVRRKIWGGGGAGGDCSIGLSDKAGAAGGGGAGGYSEDFYINPSFVATISIGAGATSGGTSSGSTITNPDGGTSSYVDGVNNLYAYGGESGVDSGGINDLDVQPGGRGGKDNSNADRVGSHGTHGTSMSETGVASYNIGCSGAGGSSAIGMGGAATSLRFVNGVGESGKPAQGKAAGGGGSISLGGGYFSGGDGGDGFIELELFA